MRDQFAQLLDRVRGADRQQKFVMVGVIAVVFFALRFGGTALVEYRDGLKDEIHRTAQRIANAHELLERADDTEARLRALRGRYQEVIARLVPGDTPTLAAAALQDRVSSLATEHNVRLQTTQVLKDEAVGPFRQVSLRITASGELKNLAGFISGLEFGPLQIRVSFIELSRRGASIRRKNQKDTRRAVSATIQIAGIVQGSAKAPEAAAQVAQVAQAEPAPAAPRNSIPDDPLGTAGQVGQP